MPIVEELNVRVEVAVPPAPSVRLFRLKEAVAPAGAVGTSETVPEKLLRLVRVMVDVPEVVTRIVWEVGLAEMLKSETLTVIMAERVRVALAALTVTV